IPPFSGASHAPDLNYDVEHFDYDPETNTYTCPQGNMLTTTGYWHVAKNPNGQIAYRFRNYTTPKCKKCEVRPLCTKSAANGKQVRRSEFAENIENNKKRMEKSEKLYKKRQAIVEHPFGTIKRQWGFNYIITKKYMERAEADFGFTMLAYNLRRIINLVGGKQLFDYLSIIFSILCSLFAPFKLFLNLTNQIPEKTMVHPKFEKQPLIKLCLLKTRSPGTGF
ncbi:transposase, partial [Sunxiuqinia sp. A32]|uniref:transposase n=1 Tax=Sunxiuqinia sp. A32 TaxID=3461496 RepID=UPI004045BB05